ncbi:hypothetical protein PIB30_024590 [Stylosanthes scabra]|uniref:DUF4283 domain-containing protein n=1 Tax=Stylosanthes scabra TaxID=79078 RepID=A0ABU6UA85_9FABA|nr:hypothetical protein [Stylosanthes scabra]
MGDRRKVESGTMTIFADNLPLSTTIGWLWRIFGKEGKYRVEALNVIRRLDRWNVWGCNIKLKKARYGRIEERKRNELQGEGTMPIPAKPDDGKGRTFKDVLLNKNIENNVHNLRDDNVVQMFGKSRVELEADEVLNERLSRSLVGETINPMRFQELRTAVMKDWHTMVDMKMMGSWKAVMTFDSLENMIEAEQSPYLLNHFMEVRRWTLREVNRSRRMWLEIHGLPANAWTETNMERIGKVWGSILRVDGGQGGHLNAFRVLVEMNFSPTIQACLSVGIQGEEMQILVKES